MSACVNGQIYNGADDNASGVAAAAGRSRRRSKASAPLHDVILALVDGEEGGLGRAGHGGDPAFRPLLERTVLAVNFDMMSRSDKNELYVRRRATISRG